MRSNTAWSDEYWLLVMQLYLRKPVGVKPALSRPVVDLGIELHLHPKFIRSKLKQIDSLSTPRIEKIWNTYSNNPKKLARAVRMLRSMNGFGSAEFYEGVEVNESFEPDFKPVNGDSEVKPVMLIMILDLYFRLTPITMVESTPEVIELSMKIKIAPGKTAAILSTFQVCDPYLKRTATGDEYLLGHCREIWKRYGNADTELLAEEAKKLSVYFL